MVPRVIWLMSVLRSVLRSKVCQVLGIDVRCRSVKSYLKVIRTTCVRVRAYVRIL